MVRTEELVTFEELGIDHIFIDEADMFKNLSSDLFTKTRYLDELAGNKGVIFATGTPVSNSMAELYTLQRYFTVRHPCRYGLDTL